MSLEGAVGKKAEGTKAKGRRKYRESMAKGRGFKYLIKQMISLYSVLDTC